ncbi:MAG TPA: hypothetical protein DEH78_04380, partial [Solibacterales bacterium]|nr:hypothetical protein [Bryobacterales bacterium]
MRNRSGEDIADDVDEPERVVSEQVAFHQAEAHERNAREPRADDDHLARAEAVRQQRPHPQRQQRGERKSERCLGGRPPEGLLVIVVEERPAIIGNADRDPEGEEREYGNPPAKEFLLHEDEAPAGKMTSSLYHGARRAVLALFFVHGFVYASWVSRIPAVQGALHLTAAELGLALLGFAAGSIPAMVLCGALIGRYGSRPLSIATTLAFCLALPAMALAPAGPWLFFALCLFGLGGGSMDVASNAHGAEVERLAGRSVMSSF